MNLAALYLPDAGGVGHVFFSCSSQLSAGKYARKVYSSFRRLVHRALDDADKHASSGYSRLVNKQPRRGDQYAACRIGGFSIVGLITN